MNTPEWKINYVDLILNGTLRRWIAHGIDDRGKFRAVWRELDMDYWFQSTYQGVIRIEGDYARQPLRRAVSNYLSTHEIVTAEEKRG